MVVKIRKAVAQKWGIEERNMRELSEMMKILLVLEVGWVIEVHVFVHLGSVHFVIHN